MARIPLEEIGRPIDQILNANEKEQINQWMNSLEDPLLKIREDVAQGWGEKAKSRLRTNRKLTALERIKLLADKDSPILQIGTLVNYNRDFRGSDKKAPGAGVTNAFIQVFGKWIVVIANDNLTASGSWWPGTPEKIQRAQEIALKLKLPVVYLVESSGLFLPEQSGSFAGQTGAGRIFKLNSVLSDAGVPQLAGVFGPCIAGGGYMPIISDIVIMTEQAYMVIAGAALIKGAKAQHLTSLGIGGPEIHVHISGCADKRAPDDQTCILMLRNELKKLPSSAVDYYRRGWSPIPPKYNYKELRLLFPKDHRESYEIREVIARIVDSSLFHEVMRDQGKEVVTGLARISGLWVGIVANDLETFEHPRQMAVRRTGGILYKEGVAKLSTFARHCNSDGIPIVWLQDVAGFDIGTEAEAQGLLGYGSSLIYSNSTSTVPMITVLLRRASGAGYYAQAGLPYDPVLQLSTPITRQGVMEGKTLAIATYNSSLDDNFQIKTTDPVLKTQIEKGMVEVENRVDTEMCPYSAASRRDTDELITLPELRIYLEAIVEMCYQSTGRRVRNPRIWTIHDLEVLCLGQS